MNEQFKINIQQAIAWGEMDAFMHVNNVVYFKFFENVRIEYFEQSNINQLMQQSKIGPILGSTECKYLAPLTYPDNIIISTRVSAIKEKRFTMQYQVFSKKLNALAAQGSGEIVYFDYNLNKTCLIPPAILDSIHRIESQII